MNDQLSSREREVLDCLAAGLRYEGIADRLGLSTETARTYVRRAMAKLEAETPAQAVALAIRAGLIQ